jgi:hypothetical protein
MFSWGSRRAQREYRLAGGEPGPIFAALAGKNGDQVQDMKARRSHADSARHFHFSSAPRQELDMKIRGSK